MEGLVQFAPIILIVVVFYFILIRPQRKKEKQVNEMRSAAKVGDKITTIGGIKGTIVKTKDDTLTIQVGADRVKIEIMRWAVSKVDESKATGTAKKEDASSEDASDKANGKTPARKPRKLTAKAAEAKDSAVADKTPVADAADESAAADGAASADEK
jgi:preprotein translocase YajC subunit